MKGKILKERGITLIALVITIIVLLILAGVTISIVLHTGIIDNSQKAVDQYAYEQQREEEALKSLSGYMHSYSNVVPIYTAEQLKQIGKGKLTVEEEKTEFDFSMSANYVLMADIDLNPGKWQKDEKEGITFTDDSAVEWTPIGTDENPFKGTFNGNGHTISGIYINSSDKDNQGLFGVIEDSTIENLTVSGSITGQYKLGAIASNVHGKSTINNCHNLCNILGESWIGGITANIVNGDVIISNCSNKGNLNSKKIEGWSLIGGIITTTNVFGGVETNKSVIITHCYNEGKITSNGIATGGIVGELVGTNECKPIVEYCYNSKDISGNAKVGGIVGSKTSKNINEVNLFDSTIMNCYNTGKIEGNDKVGGIAGQCYQGEIKNSYNRGEVKLLVSKTSSIDIGGIVGYFQRGKLSNCYNRGTVKDLEGNLLDGIVGSYSWFSGTLQNNYYLNTSAATGKNGVENVTGEAERKTETEMQESSFVETLNNGENNWKKDKEGTEAINEGYPILSWQ